MAEPKRKQLCREPGCKATAFAAVDVCIKHFVAMPEAERGVPIPPNVDIRSFDDMPLNVRAVRDSDTLAEVSDEGFKAAFQLWCAAWHQIPASSVPNNDEKLARLAGYGRDVKRWKKVRDEALRGFFLCSDGRLYHLYMCDKAWEAWGRSAAGKASAERRWGTGQVLGKPQNQGMGSHKSGISPRIANPNANPDATADADAMRPDMGSQCSDLSRVEKTTTSSISTTAPARAAAADVDLISRTADEVWRIAGRTTEGDRKRTSGNIDDFRHVRTWLEQGFSETEITTAAKSVIENAGEIRSLWGLLAKAMPDAIAKLRQNPGSNGPAPGAEDPRPELRYREYRKTGSWREAWGDPERDTPEHIRARVDEEMRGSAA